MGNILDGSALAKKMRAEIKIETEKYINKYHVQPHLAVI